MARLMEIDLLAAKLQRFPALAEGHYLEAKSSGIEVARNLYVSNGQNEVVDTVNHLGSFVKWMGNNGWVIFL